MQNVITPELSVCQWHRRWWLLTEQVQHFDVHWKTVKTLIKLGLSQRHFAGWVNELTITTSQLQWFWNHPLDFSMASYLGPVGIKSTTVCRRYISTFPNILKGAPTWRGMAETGIQTCVFLCIPLFPASCVKLCDDWSCPPWSEPAKKTNGREIRKPERDYHFLTVNIYINKFIHKYIIINTSINASMIHTSINKSIHEYTLNTYTNRSINKLIFT